jgi:hypothetical protein
LEEKDREIERLKERIGLIMNRPVSACGCSDCATQSAAGWTVCDGTAPSCGNILVYNEKYGEISVGWYDYNSKLWFDAHDRKPTHWMPLPSPPSLQENTNPSNNQ